MGVERDAYKKWVGSMRRSKVGSLQGLDKEGVGVVWNVYKKWVGSLWHSKVGLHWLDKEGVGVALMSPLWYVGIQGGRVTGDKDQEHLLWGVIDSLQVASKGPIIPGRVVVESPPLYITVILYGRL